MSGKIAHLNALSGEDLKNEMVELKALLLSNPSATTLLLPEEIGEMVKAIERQLGVARMLATEKPKKGKVASSKPKQFSKEELDNMLSELNGI